MLRYNITLRTKNDGHSLYCHMLVPIYCMCEMVLMRLHGIYM
jgi:hypothetical protein